MGSMKARQKPIKLWTQVAQLFRFLLNIPLVPALIVLALGSEIVQVIVDAFHETRLGHQIASLVIAAFLAGLLCLFSLPLVLWFVFLWRAYRDRNS
jgi:hypothetical protein